MAEVIHLPSKAEEEGLICSKPWEFRKAVWHSTHFLQMIKSESSKLSSPLLEACQIPAHFLLSGGMDFTIRAIFANRRNEKVMREIYYLAGLIDCMINQVNPILRTDLIRALYKKIIRMKKSLNIVWYSRLDQVLLPIDSRFFNELEYRSDLSRALTLQKLYQAIREGTDVMFDILSQTYLFYCPKVGR